MPFSLTNFDLTEKNGNRSGVEDGNLGMERKEGSLERVVNNSKNLDQEGEPVTKRARNPDDGEEGDADMAERQLTGTIRRTAEQTENVSDSSDEVEAEYGGGRWEISREGLLGFLRPRLLSSLETLVRRLTPLDEEHAHCTECTDPDGPLDNLCFFTCPLYAADPDLEMKLRVRTIVLVYHLPVLAEDDKVEDKRNEEGWKLARLVAPYDSAAGNIRYRLIVIDDAFIGNFLQAERQDPLAIAGGLHRWADWASDPTDPESRTVHTLRCAHKNLMGHIRLVHGKRPFNPLDGAKSLGDVAGALPEFVESIVDTLTQLLPDGRLRVIRDNPRRNDRREDKVKLILPGSDEVATEEKLRNGAVNLYGNLGVSCVDRMEIALERINGACWNALRRNRRI